MVVDLKKILGCILGISLLATLGQAQRVDTPYFINARQLGLEVNSNAEEMIPMLSPDGNTLYFARYLHDGNKGGKESGHDIWVARKKDSSWAPAQNFAYLNTTSSDAIVGIAPSGKKVYLLNDNTNEKAGIGHIMIDQLDGSQLQLQDPISFPSTMNDVYGVFVQPDGNYAFVSVKHDSLEKRGYEIVIFKKLRSGWRRMNMRGINTEHDEFAPFLSHDTILYFASNRPNGEGGFDIYWSKPENEYFTKWSAPKNLGPEINSEAFDAYFSVYPDGSAYFVSNRNARLSDIYTCQRAKKPKPEPKEEVVEEPLPEPNETQVMKADLEKKGQAAPKFVYFESNSADLTDSTLLTLNRLIDIVQNDASVDIELRGYSDNLGSAEYNLVLSEKRSESVKAYLISKGVSPDRITTIGKGMASPLSSNDTEEGRARNRRVRLILYKS